MKFKEMLRASYSTTEAAKACGAKPKSVTNHIALKNIKPDLEAAGSGTGHELTGYSIIRMSLFFELSRAMKFRQASNAIWPFDEISEKLVVDAVEMAVERYGKGASEPVQFVVFLDKNGWSGEIIDSVGSVQRMFHLNKALAITVSISDAVKTVIESLKTMERG